MKKFIILILIMTVFPIAFAGCSCKNDNANEKPSAPTYVTVTFKQDGQSDVTKTVEKGKALTDIPAPATKKGYNVVWDKTDFSEISEDTVVNAVATANTYTITFDYGDSGYVGAATMQVTYDAEFTFPEDTAKEFVFKGVSWILSDSGDEIAEGVYNFDEDITVKFTYVTKDKYVGVDTVK